MKEILISVIIGDILGSIPFALVIGKIFYKTDIRNFGSKNLGGSNSGRVLGKKAGIAVMTLDVLKVIVAIGIASLIGNAENVMLFAGFAAAIGHCYPVFANFKGGKAVATLYGFLFGMAFFGTYNFTIFFVPFVTFLLPHSGLRPVLEKVCSYSLFRMITGCLTA